MDPLWGKYHTTGVTLLRHTRDVVEAGRALFGTADQLSRLGREWLRFFRLDPVADGPRFADTLLAAMLTHDWGKANADMQAVLTGARGDQRFRHEHLSVLVLGCDWGGRWRQTGRLIDWPVVLATVGSHHLKFRQKADGTPADFARSRSGVRVRMCLDHVEFERLLELTVAELGLPERPRLPSEREWGFESGHSHFNLANTRKRCAGILDDLEDDARLLNAVRAALIAADAAGSGLPRQNQSVVGWLAERFPDEPACDEPFVRRIVQARVVQLAAAGKWTGDSGWDSPNWNHLQRRCDTLGGRALVLAPCGYGKTLAAWRWIAAQVKERPVSRVLFLYPTRATATEGFKDYVSWAPEDAAGLLHGTAGFDLDGMFPAEDPRHECRFADTDPRLFAVQHWGKRVFSATVDQFLAFLSYGYGPMCLLPLLADSVLVVDEVHSFDPKMFSGLLQFLKAFDVPVLCMTATLPAPRINQLRETDMAICDMEEVKTSAEATAERYAARRVEAADVLARVTQAVRDGRRVLWVVNQVSRAQQATAALQAAKLDPLCYHSRFTLSDRRDRHRDVVAALQRENTSGVVAVTTQVCEMSLDIDADLLVTEECPITSLVQRMGRCRRGRGEVQKHGPGGVLVYKPADKEWVYDADDLTGLVDFLADITGRDAVSQADLEAGLTKHGPKGREGERRVPFLNGQAYAVADPKVDSFRDIEQHNLQAVLPDELNQYLAAGRDAQPGFVVPIPRKLRDATTSHPKLPKWLCIAPPGHYDPLTGFWDKPLGGSV